MKKYLKDLPNKSKEHKERFALLVSGGFTLMIFAVWAFVNFGPEPQIALDQNTPVNLAAVSEAEVTPFENVWYGLRESVQNFKSLISNGE